MEKLLTVDEVMDKKGREELIADWMQTYKISSKDIDSLKRGKKCDYIVTSIVQEDDTSKGQVIEINLLENKTKTMEFCEIPLYRIDKAELEEEWKTMASNMIICQMLLEKIGCELKLDFRSWAQEYYDQIKLKEQKRIIAEKMNPKHYEGQMVINFI